MHRYEKLEKLYYKKLFFKYFIFFVFVFLCIIGYSFFKRNHKEVVKIKKISNKKTIQKIKKRVVLNKKIENIHFILPDINNLLIQKETKIKNVSIKSIKDTSNLNQIKIIEKTPDLKTLIKKFNTTKDFDLAILISKIYFKNNDLKNARIWALKANNINPSSYKSWDLFADILLKEKKIQKAKKILKVYIDSYGQNDIIEEKLRSINAK